MSNYHEQPMLQALLEQAEVFFQHQSTGVVMIDPQQSVVFINKAAQELLGMKSSASNSPFPSTQISISDLFKDYDQAYKTDCDFTQDYLTLAPASPYRVETEVGQRVEITQSPLEIKGNLAGKLLLLRSVREGTKESMKEVCRYDEDGCPIFQGDVDLRRANEILRTELRQRRLKEAELIKQGKLLRLSEQAKNFLLTFSNYDTAIKKALQVIGEYTNVDEVYVCSERLDENTLYLDKSLGDMFTSEFAWKAEGAPDLKEKKDQLQKFLAHTFDEIDFSPRFSLLLDGESLQCTAKEFSGRVRTLGIKSLLIVPIILKECLLGVICFVDYKKERHWTYAETKILQSIATSFGGAIWRKQIEDNLKDSEERYKTLVTNSFDLISEATMQGRFTYISPQTAQILGYERWEVLKKRILGFIHKEDRPAVYRRFKSFLRSSSFKRTLFRFKHKNGDWVWLEGHGGLYETTAGEKELVLVARDVTLQKKIDEEILKANKLESSGLLAAGMAHDFSNFLAIIWGRVSLALRTLEQDSKTYSILKESEKTFVRARNLTQNLLTFAKVGFPQKKRVNLGKLLNDLAQLALQGSKLNLRFKPLDDLWLVEADEGQIGQVMTNLFLNARQATPKGGRIEVDAENIIISAEEESPLPEGKYVKVSVTDTGVGIKEKDLPKIFDPYFTTKQDGTGLGLATSYSIIKKHGGHIFVYSKEGLGTRFCVYLPAG